jgi:hypothetical protein
MKRAEFTASTAAFLLSASALMAQEAQSQTFQSVFIDVGGTAVLVPMDVALEACGGLDEASLQSAARSRLQDSGADETQFYAQLESATAMMGQRGEDGTGDATATNATTADASGADNTDPFIVLAACQIDQDRATELQVDMTQTATSLGFDAVTLGIESGTANQ